LLVILGGATASQPVVAMMAKFEAATARQPWAEPGQPVTGQDERE
jgi:hypothetical protein